MRYKILVVGFLAMLMLSMPTYAEERRVINVSIQGFAFDPNPITVTPGEDITFVVENKDAAGHTFTISELSVDLVLSSGETKQVNVTIPTDFESASITCRFHSSMSASLKADTDETNNTSSEDTSDTSSEDQSNTDTDPTSNSEEAGSPMWLVSMLALIPLSIRNKSRKD